MASRLHRHKKFIVKFKNSSEALRKKYLKPASDDQIRSLCECALNICNGNIPLKSHQKKKLLKFKKDIQSVAFRKSSIISKKKLFIQKGGFLPLIASVVGGLLSSLIL